MPKQAYVSEIQRFCVHDGAGIRTNVFFQGCQLRCKWCQNPETISMKPVILYNQELCRGCGSCLETCTKGAISVDADVKLKTDRQGCDLCGACTKECYFLARSLSGRQYTVDEVYDLVMKDEVVYKNSGGGITISGGEPLLHREFNVELLKRCQEAGINTAIETAGYVPFTTIEAVSPYTDTFLFDCKAFTEAVHEEWVGVSNQLILENIRKLTDIHDNVVIRVPLIPGVNDSDEEFGRIVEFVSSLRQINSMHILPFHHFGSGKYSLIGIDYECAHFEDENEEQVTHCAALARTAGLKVNVGGTGFIEDRKVDENVIKMKESFLYE